MIYPNKENKLANTKERNTEAPERVVISIVENANLLVQEAQQTSRKIEKKKKSNVGVLEWNCMEKNNY